MVCSDVPRFALVRAMRGGCLRTKGAQERAETESARGIGGSGGVTRPLAQVACRARGPRLGAWCV
jgi:hypothetical protein